MSRFRRGSALAAAGLFVSMLGGLWVTASGSAQVAAVPDLTGCARGIAEAYLHQHGIDYATDDGPSATLQGTAPNGGNDSAQVALLYTASTTSASHSCGFVRVPDVEARGADVATDVVRSAGLSVSAPTGFVTGESPAPGTIVALQALVTLTVGAEPESGLQFDGCSYGLPEAYLLQHGEATVPDDRGKGGDVVLKQTGTGFAGPILLGYGPGPSRTICAFVDVPGVEELSSQQADKALAADDLVPRDPPGLVVDQFPPAGTVVTRRSAVQLIPAATVAFLGAVTTTTSTTSTSTSTTSTTAASTTTTTSPVVPTSQNIGPLPLPTNPPSPSTTLAPHDGCNSRCVAQGVSAGVVVVVVALGLGLGLRHRVHGPDRRPVPRVAVRQSIRVQDLARGPGHNPMSVSARFDATRRTLRWLTGDTDDQPH